MPSRFASLLAAALFVASPLQSQSVHFQFTDAGAGYNAFGIYMGTYGGTWDYTGANQHHVGFNCVDFFHEVSFGQQWDANISSLGTGDVSKARHANSLSVYQQAAWLIANYSPSNVQATQSTLWNLFGDPGPNWQADQALLAQSLAPHPGFDYNNWYVVTDVFANSVSDASSVQEFVVYDPTVRITATPEPATAALLGTGLLGLMAVRMRRRRKQ